MNEMKRTRMIRLVSPATGDALDNFVNTFDEDMFVKPGAEIALLNATIPLQDTLLQIQSGVNDTLSISYNGGNSYIGITIPAASYTLPQLVEQIQFFLPRTVPAQGGQGIEYDVKVDAKGNLQINFIQTQTYEDKTQANTGQVNVVYNANTDAWTPDIQPDLTGLQYWYWNFAPFTLGSGFVEVDTKGSAGAGGIINLGLGRQDVLHDRFGDGDEVDITDPDQIVYGMQLDGTSVSYFHENGSDQLLSVTAQNNDSLRMEFDNEAGTVTYHLWRAGASVISATETFTESLRYQTNAAQLSPYVGFLDADSVAANVRFTPSVDDQGEVSYLNKTLVLAFPTEQSKIFYGFDGADFTVKADGAKGGTFQGTTTPKNNGYIPAIAVELSNLELQTYDGKRQEDGRFGRVRSIVAVIPGIEPQNRSITYEPPEPTYIAVNNRDEINLNKLEVRLLTEDDTYLTFIPRACLTLAIRD